MPIRVFHCCNDGANLACPGGELSEFGTRTKKKKERKRKKGGKGGPASVEVFCASLSDERHQRAPKTRNQKRKQRHTERGGKKGGEKGGGPVLVVRILRDAITFPLGS